MSASAVSFGGDSTAAAELRTFGGSAAAGANGTARGADVAASPVVVAAPRADHGIAGDKSGTPGCRRLDLAPGLQAGVAVRLPRLRPNMRAYDTSSTESCRDDVRAKQQGVSSPRASARVRADEVS
jgi:hypothetical protein